MFMRLIDLEAEMLKKNLVISKYEGGLSAKRAIRLFMNQPTVEAIPIDWIEERIKNIEDTLLEMSYRMLIEDWREYSQRGDKQ